jgi:hypothetical protein
MAQMKLKMGHPNTSESPQHFRNLSSQFLIRFPAATFFWQEEAQNRDCPKRRFSVINSSYSTKQTDF